MKELIKKGFDGTITDEELKVYISSMSKEEKEIGKPVFLMNEEEYKRYDVLVYNNQNGELTGFNCDVCKNKGLLANIINGVISYTPCKCNKIRENYARLEKSGLGELIGKYSFANYNASEDWQKLVIDKAKNFVTNNDRSFIMIGCSGAGKTHICTAISTNLIIKGYDLKYMVWVDEVVKLKQNKMNDGIYNAMMNTFKKAPVLYIDDFLKCDGDTKPSSADLMIAFEIINYRYNNKNLKTIISSERSQEQLLEYDEAIYGRIKEMAGNNLIVLQGNKNYRLK